jgi:hypothetical protein
MGIYSDIYASGNISGRHVFNGAALTVIGGGSRQLRNTRPDADGERLDVVDGAATVITGLLIHRNGRQGLRDLSVDKIVLTIEQLHPLPDAVQEALRPFENMPGGRVR